MAQSNKVPASAGAISSFAHLAGVLAAKADNDTDEKDNEKDKDKEEKEAKAKKAEDEEAKKAAAEEKEEDDKKKDEDKARKAAMPKDENEDKEKEGRHAERRRIHAIMTCAGAAHAVDEAERLAFHTDMPAGLAISNLNVKAMEVMLEKAQKPAPKAASKDSLRDRMHNEPTPDIGADGGETSTGDAYQDQVRAATAAIVAADAKRRGVKSA